MTVATRFFHNDSQIQRNANFSLSETCLEKSCLLIHISFCPVAYYSYSIRILIAISRILQIGTQYC